MDPFSSKYTFYMLKWASTNQNGPSSSQNGPSGDQSGPSGGRRGPTETRVGSLEARIVPLEVRVDKCTCDLFENGVKFVKSDFDRLWAPLGLLGPFEAQRGVGMPPPLYPPLITVMIDF